MLSDPFRHVSVVPGSPARQAFAIVKDVDLPLLPSAIYVGVGGDVVLRAADSATDVTYRNVPAGAYLTVRAQIVRSAGTTANDLVAEL